MAVTYTVQYKELSETKWHKINKVEQDGFIEDYNIRFLMDSDNVRYEIPATNVMFKFSAERTQLIIAASQNNKDKEKEIN